MGKAINHIVLVGAVTRVDEVKTTPSGLGILVFTLGGDRSYYDELGQTRTTPWYHRVTVMGQKCDEWGRQLQVGEVMQVVGSIRKNQWEDNQGNQRQAVDVKALAVERLIGGMRQELFNSGRLKDSQNEAFIVGNLTRDVVENGQVKRNQSGDAYAQFTVAVDVGYKDRNGEWVNDPQYLDIKCWQAKAEFAATLKKGNRVAISGSLLSNKGKDKETGEDRYYTYLLAERIERSIKWDEDASSAGYTQSGNGGVATTTINAQASHLDIDEEFPPEEDLPF